MKYAAISQDFFNKYSFDGDELTHNKDEKRPYAIILKLNFEGEKYDFALPFRSHIKSYVEKSQYFSLPPNSSTKKGEVHGLHYLKMFPVKKEYLIKYRVQTNKLNTSIDNIIKEKKATIVLEAQNYLDEYSKNGRPPYGVDIKGLLNKLNI